MRSFGPVTVESDPPAGYLEAIHVLRNYLEAKIKDRRGKPGVNNLRYQQKLILESAMWLELERDRAIKKQKMDAAT